MEQGLDLISWDELEEYAVANPAEWFIPEIMQAYTFNVLCGWPKAGKSSFTRDLASCVISGGDFLGRRVQHGSVLYVTTEQGKTAVRNEMKHFGIDREAMRKGFVLSTCSPKTPAEFVQRLRASLKERPEIRLVVLDTLPDFLPNVNLDIYSDVKPRLGDFVRLCEELRVTILALHHFNKQGRTLLASIAGSQAIGASADTIMGIWGNEDRPRYFETTSRDRAFPKTRLFINQVSKKVSSGESGTKEAVGDDGDVGRIRGEAKRVLEFIRDNDGVTQSEIVTKLGCVQSKVSGYLKKQLGKHVRHDGAKPRRYYAVGSEIEIMEEPLDLDAAAA